ncbi:alkaline phosphatase PhoX [Actinocrispum wychmicini]|uniref:Phosphatase n=1 Tax=Actinocrispum wychmicini TaxID=1213861 RepID=A0A4R2JNE7_9PSEU|nr:alkaline phosphatase PhoX [Actinocrispum wychmicini]TCO55705.1 hypothetical protein EV192_107127 [Actinocrispum wychmicini]
MRPRRHVVTTTIAGVASLLVVAAAISASASTDDAGLDGGRHGGGLRLTPVGANAKTTGVTVPNSLSPELTEQQVAEGARRLENPTTDISFYGYRGDGPLLPAPGDLPAAGHLVEASKTEPDKNTYLILRGQHGADPTYDYGTHFLFQGHEAGATGYLTRINLDADPAHRVTLLATKTTSGAALPNFDGSTWDPWARKLLFTAELGNQGGVWQAAPDLGGPVQDISFALGRGGYEGIQNDSAGNLLIVEDVGGATVPGDKAKLPNSFVYRYVPHDRDDLTYGKLQALQVISRRSGQPIAFQPIDAGHPTGNAFSDDVKDLHTYGGSFATHWVTIHDTATDSSGQAFDANALAKAAKATPFKRPENGQFRPGTGFREFYFDETGDTNADSTANNGFGGWGSVLKLTQDDPRADNGRLSLVYNGDKEHTGLDNVTFVDANHVAFVEDAGDGLHTQRGLLDSAYLFDINADYAHGAQPLRFLGEGRDPSATIDSALSGKTGFQNDGDNEITGIHMSNGDPSPRGILGEQRPTPFDNGWRLFWTQQHGDNITWEIVSTRR